MEQYFYVLLFFTVWNLLLIIFHKYTHKYFHLLYLSYMTFMVGMYFSTVNPAKFVFYFKDKKIVVDKWFYLLLIDILFHISVFIFVLIKYYSYYSSLGRAGNDMLLLSSVMLLVIYICLIDPSRVYGISYIEIIAVIAATNLLYFAIF